MRGRERSSTAIKMSELCKSPASHLLSSLGLWKRMCKACTKRKAQTIRRVDVFSFLEEALHAFMERKHAAFVIDGRLVLQGGFNRSS